MRPPQTYDSVAEVAQATFRTGAIAVARPSASAGVRSRALPAVWSATLVATVALFGSAIGGYTVSRIGAHVLMDKARHEAARAETRAAYLEAEAQRMEIEAQNRRDPQATARLASHYGLVAADEAFQTSSR